MKHPSVSMLVGVFVALMLLLAATVLIAEVDLGRMNFIAAAGIASLKALLIVMIFMNVRYSPGLTRLFAGAGFFWLLILLGLTLTDYLTRGWLR